MKGLAIFAAVIGLISGAFLAWWDIKDGTRFNRAQQTLMEFAPEEFSQQVVIDPWGNPYMVVKSISDETSLHYVFSRGPDGGTESFGNGPDDITRWTGRSEWLTSLYPVSLMMSLLVLSVVVFVGSVSFVIGRSLRADPGKSDQIAS